MALRISIDERLSSHCRTKQRVVAVTTHSTYGGIAILVQTALDMRFRMDKLVHTHALRLRNTCAHAHSLIA